MSRERERFGEIGKKIKREMIEASSNEMENMRHNNVKGCPPPVGLTLNTITPCAACKLLRRRCAEECPFSPYFSPHEPQKFAAVHKVFGASNVSKLLLEVPEGQRADAANSLVYEANVRLRDPVYGCMGAISALQQQLQSLQAQLNSVKAEILKYKYREVAATNRLIGSTHSSLVSSGMASVAELPPVLSFPPLPPLALPRPPPPPPPPPPSFVVSSSCSSSLTSFYTSPDTAMGCNSNIPSDSVLYFD